jgi:hypothetical protein
MSEKAMVAVCDILGFSNLVKSCSLTELKDLHMNNIRNLMKSSIAKFGEKIVAPTPEEVFAKELVGHAVFSDTIILYSLSDERDGYRNVLNAVYRLIGIPMFTPIYKYRVGIAYGEFYHDKNESIYIGKALAEASDLEKCQEWSGATLSDVAANIFRDNDLERSMMVEYDVPIKTRSGMSRKRLSVIDWTQANHPAVVEESGWMYREQDGIQVQAYSNPDVEQKILNTELFHTDNCVQCREMRKHSVASRETPKSV